VILEAGWGFSSATWIGIRPQVARRTRACAYDRLGEGESDPPRAKEIRTMDDQAKTLADVLDAAGIDCPCVLVGHSLGGAIVRRFASRHRDDVAGIVLVDSSHGDATRKWGALLPARPTNGRDPFREVRSMLDESGDALSDSEHLDWPASEKQMRELRSLDAIPLVVLTAGANELATAFPHPYDVRASKIWLDGHSELAALSSDSVHAIAQYSGHFIHESQPDVVVASIRAVVGAARRDQRLPPCRTLFRGVAGVRCL
jgi:pimeloyl-ACP methyl ester carboxylesterase